MIKDKIGIGIITYKRPDFFKHCYNSMPWDSIDVSVIVNDGPEYDLESEGIVLNDKTTLIQHEKNMKVCKSKNDAINFLYESGCEHIFIIEDDVMVVDPDVFNIYIKTSRISGIKHLNYGPASPFNREQDPGERFDLHNRHLAREDTKPLPRLIVEYKDDVKVALYHHTVAAFVYYHYECIDKVGVFDEAFNMNAWEHVDHTYRIIKAGMHPPFWWFADVGESEHLIKSQDAAIKKSSIAGDTTVPWEEQEWAKGVMKGIEIYKSKHGHTPNNPPIVDKTHVIKCLKNLKP